MNEAVHRWSDNEGHQFRNKGAFLVSGYVRKNYYCIRSECRRQADSDKYRKFYDDKDIGCEARLSVYQFDDEEGVVYIHQKGEHNHERGHRYTTLVPEASARLVRLFQNNPSLKPNEYLTDRASQLSFDSANKAVRMETRNTTDLPRSELLTIADVQRARNKARSKQYLLQKDETPSVDEWIDTLRKADKVLFHQKRVESGNGTRATPFQLGLLSSLGRDMLEDHNGKPGAMVTSPISIDATFNTTKDPRMLLYTVIGRDSHGHGVPLSHLLTDSKECAIIIVWLRALRDRFEGWKPTCVLTDTAPEQISAIEQVFSRDILRLCTWHVLENFRKALGGTRVWPREDSEEFETFTHSLLPRLRALVKEPSVAVFERDLAALVDDFNQSSPSVAERKNMRYLQTYYLRPNSTHPPKDWALCYRQSETGPLADMNTTMLSESYHNTLKNTLCFRKVRNRMDSLIYTLMVRSVYYFGWKLRIQAAGKDVRTHAHSTAKSREKAALLKSIGISDSDFSWTTDNQCHYTSPSSSEVYLITVQNVFVMRESCTCKDFERWQSIRSHKCKHIFAANRARANSESDLRLAHYERMSSLGTASDSLAHLPEDPEAVPDFSNRQIQAEWDTLGPTLEELLEPLPATPLPFTQVSTSSSNATPLVAKLPPSPERKDLPNVLIRAGASIELANQLTSEFVRHPTLLSELMNVLKRPIPEDLCAVSISDRNKSRKLLPNVGTTTNMRPNMNKTRKTHKSATKRNTIVEVDLGLGIASGLEKLLKFNNSGGEVSATGAEIICLD